LYLIGVDVRRVRQGRHHSAELDEVAIAIVPLVEQGEILVDLVDRHDVSAARIASL
jgi:hypothetical protein